MGRSVNRGCMSDVAPGSSWLLAQDTSMVPAGAGLAGWAWAEQVHPHPGAGLAGHRWAATCQGPVTCQALSRSRTLPVMSSRLVYATQP